MIPVMLKTLVLLIVAMLAVAACGGLTSSDEEQPAAAFATEGFAEGLSMPAPAPAPAMAPRAPAAPAAAALAPSPIIVERAFAVEAEVVPEGPPIDEAVAQLVTQTRIIIRTVDMSIEVTDILGSTDAISAMAREMGVGGWVVSTNRFQKHRGFISFRVPADSLDQAIARLREMAVEVNSEVIDSRDVTDEYSDLVARLRNQTATEAALLRLLDRAESVEDALEVRKSLTQVQEEVKRLQGRIKLLEQTSAFSLVRVTLELKPLEMVVEDVPDKTTGVGESVRFRAFFKPPEDIEDFRYTWDFGDGTRLEGTQTAPTEEKDTRVTATVTHRYRDEEDSPFIVQFEIAGTGEAGAAEGETTLMVNVTRVLEIVVFAGENIVIEEGEQVEFAGSFTRPEGVGDVEFTWDFGDGVGVAKGTLEAGVTNGVATHTYKDHRPFPYAATLTITAESEAGKVEGASSVRVLVTESEGWVIAGWNAADQGKTAVRALSGVGQVALSALIWVAILSPAWLPIGAAGIWVGRSLRRRRRRRKLDSSGNAAEAASETAGEQ